VRFRLRHVLNSNPRPTTVGFWPLAQAPNGSASPGAVGGGEVLRYGGDAAFEPFESLDAQGRPKGFQIELLAALGQRLGVPVTVSLRPWAETEAAFRSGELDLIALVPTAERRRWALFGRGHATPALAAYRQAGIPEPQGAQDLAGRRIVVPAGEAMRETLATTLSGLPPAHLTAADAADALRAVAEQRAEVAVLLRAYAEPLLAQGQVSGVVASRLDLGLQTYAFAVAPDRQVLLQRVQAALDGLEADGTLEALRMAWLPSHRGLAEAHRLKAGLQAERSQTWAVAGVSALALGGLGWALVRRARAVQREKQRRLQAEGALRRAEELLERSFTQHPEAMLVIERGSAIVRDANAAAHALLGLPASSLIGQPLPKLGQHLPEAAVQALAATLDLEGEITGMPLRLRQADGSTRDCLLSADEMQIGESRQVFCLLRDITETLARDAEMRHGYDTLLTELRGTETELDRAREARARAEQRLEDFTQAVVHDLKSPLRAMQGFVGLLRERLLAGHTREALAYSEHIARAGQRMNSMVSALSKLAQVSRQPLRRQTVDMTVLAQGTWAMLVIGHRDWQTDFSTSPLPVAEADPDLIGQVWQNLLHNAGKYSVGVPTPRVRVDSHRDERGQWYRVADNGVGFDMSRAAGLFQPFQRMHSGPRFEGTGIGLSVVRRIVELHGGEVRLRSAPGVGTVAEFTLDPPPAPGAAPA
jgi:PAS domain S-box-containing protein